MIILADGVALELVTSTAEPIDFTITYWIPNIPPSCDFGTIAAATTTTLSTGTPESTKRIRQFAFINRGADDNTVRLQTKVGGTTTRRTKTVTLSPGDAFTYTDGSYGYPATAAGGGQPLDATLTALAGLVTSADQLIYATGLDVFALTTLTAFARTILDDADAPTVRATIGATTSAYVDAAIAALINSAPGVLDTLAEIASALGNDANYAATISALLALKAPLASPTFTGPVTVPDGSFALAKLANMATASLYYRKTAGSGPPEVNTLATLKTDLAIVKGDVALGNVDNVADANKPVSSAQQTALNLKADLSLIASLISSAEQRVLMSTLAPGNAGLLLISGTAYFVYLGKVVFAFTPKFVETHVSTIGAGAQTAEVGFFSTPSAPNKTAQSLTKLVSTGTVDALTATGVKRNTSAFATSVAAGTHLWAGIRTAMATTQPTIQGIGTDMAQGQILSLAAAGALTGSGPFAGAIVAAGTGVGAPDLRGTLD